MSVTRLDSLEWLLKLELVLERREAVAIAGFFIDKSSGVSGLLELDVKWLIENLFNAD